MINQREQGLANTHGNCRQQLKERESSTAICNFIRKSNFIANKAHFHRGSGSPGSHATS